MSQPILETRRLRLRPFSLADALDVQRLCSAPEIASRTLNIPHPYHDGIAESWIATHTARFESRETVFYAITLQDSGELCGSVSLIPVWRDLHAELGYWLGVPYWGQGYMPEAAQALLDYGFNEWGLNRIHASHFCSNPASGRVLQKIGMSYEGCLRQHRRKDARFEDAVCYGIVREDWQRHETRQAPAR